MRRKRSKITDNGGSEIKLGLNPFRKSLFLPTTLANTNEYSKHLATAGVYGYTWLPVGADPGDMPNATPNANFISRMTTEVAVISARVDRMGYDPGIGPVEVRRYINAVADVISGYHLLLELLTLEKYGRYVSGKTAVTDNYVSMLESFLNSLPFPQQLYDRYIKMRGVFKLPGNMDRVRVVSDLPYHVKVAANRPSTYLSDFDQLAVLIGNFAIAIQNDGSKRRVANNLSRVFNTLKVVPKESIKIHEADSIQAKTLLTRLYNHPYYNSSALGFAGSNIDPVVISTREDFPVWTLDGSYLDPDMAIYMAAYLSGTRLEHGQSTLIVRADTAGTIDNFYITASLGLLVSEDALTGLATEQFFDLFPQARESASTQFSTGDFATHERFHVSTSVIVEVAVEAAVRDINASFK